MIVCRWANAEPSQADAKRNGNLGMHMYHKSSQDHDLEDPFSARSGEIVLSSERNGRLFKRAVPHAINSKVKGETDSLQPVPMSDFNERTEVDN